MNVSDVFDVAVERRRAEREAQRKRESDIFFNRCLREISGRDAYEFLVIKASRILKCRPENCYRFVDYYFENRDHFDCGFEDWLKADNGPLFRPNVRGLFPEFEVLTDDRFEICEMARKYYGIEIYTESEYEGYGVWSREFSFRDLNKRRVNMEKVKEAMKAMMIEEVR